VTGCCSDSNSAVENAGISAELPYFSPRTMTEIDAIDAILRGEEKSAAALSPVVSKLKEWDERRLEEASGKVWIASRDGILPSTRTARTAADERRGVEDTAWRIRRDGVLLRDHAHRQERGAETQLFEDRWELLRRGR